MPHRMDWVIRTGRSLWPFAVRSRLIDWGRWFNRLESASAPHNNNNNNNKTQNKIQLICHLSCFFFKFPTSEYEGFAINCAGMSCFQAYGRSARSRVSPSVSNYQPNKCVTVGCHYRETSWFTKQTAFFSFHSAVPTAFLPLMKSSEEDINNE